MELTIFLAKLLGVYLLIITLELLLRRKEFDKAVKDFANSKGLLVFSGSISLFLGLAVVITHPILKMDLQGLITLIGYLLIIRGAMRVAFPSALQKVLLSFFRKGYWAIVTILLVLGVYLTYAGFNAI